MFRLLVIADVHYSSGAPEAPEAAGRRCRLGRELLRRAIEDAKRRAPAGAAPPFDAIALLGDLVDDGSAPHAGADLERLRTELEAAAPGTPLLVVPGNHDGRPDQVLRAFAFEPGLHELGGYRFVVFADAYEDDTLCTRRQRDRERLRELARRGGAPIVVLQHNPMNPLIEDDYPYMLTNRQAVLRDYADAGVLLSLSGHYHAGQPLNAADGVRYFTAAALAEAPFSYAVVSLKGREVSVEPRSLLIEGGPPLVDGHAHTEFAYCAQDVTAAAVIERARTFGLAGVVLTEHAPQLYCTSDEFWQGRHLDEPERWRSREHSRMAGFRRAMDPLRGEFVRVGLEVELDGDGRLTAHPADREWADRLVGAIHWPGRDLGTLGEAAFIERFLRTTRGILSEGVDVLAHPLRLFRAYERPVPGQVLAELAEMLAETDTAFEVNFHNVRPYPEAIAECIRRGVKLALASDAHELWEAALLQPHAALLKRVAGTDEIGPLLLD